MPGPVQTLAAGIVDPISIPAVAKISPNTRVRTATGFIGTIGDTVTFPGLPVTLSLTGQWLVPNARTLAAGLPTISASATGLAVTPLGPWAPIVVVAPDTRVSAQ